MSWNKLVQRAACSVQRNPPLSPFNKGGRRGILQWTMYYALCTVFLSGCVQKQYKETRLLMGTIVEITVRGNEIKARDAADKAFRKIAELEKMLSVYRNDSEISVLNRTGKVNPSPEFMEVMKESVRAGDITEGAFDITVAPMVNLWGFGPQKTVDRLINPCVKIGSLKVNLAGSSSIVDSKKNEKKGQSVKVIPEEKEIKKALESINYKNIGIDEKNNLIYFKKKGMQINLGGIAKGYAVDKAIEVLKKEGIKRAIVNAGGNLYAMGTTWHIGIKNPRKEGILKTITLKDKAVATSGDYERFFISTYKGKQKRFHHIFDPRTGYPAEECISATAIAPTGVESDWLSTGVFVLGPEKGLALIKKLGYKGIIIDSKEEILTAE